MSALGINAKERGTRANPAWNLEPNACRKFRTRRAVDHLTLGLVNHGTACQRFSALLEPSLPVFAGFLVDDPGDVAELGL